MGLFKKKPRKDFLTKLLAIFKLTGLLVCLMLVIQGISGAIINYHNLDLIYNAGLMINDLNNENLYNASGDRVIVNFRLLQDTPLSGNSNTLIQWHRISWASMFYNVTIALAGALVLGMILQEIFLSLLRK